MRWKSPKHRDVRYRRVFAFFPKRIEDETLWLEFYLKKEQFRVVGHGGTHEWGCWELEEIMKKK